MSRRKLGDAKIIRSLWPLATLLALVVVASLMCSQISPEVDRSVTVALIDLILVVGLYIFVGNSGVLSFGHISFMAVGAYTAAVLSLPIAQKNLLLPNLPPFIATVQLSPVLAIAAGGAAAAVFAAIVAVPLMRMSGLRAGLASFAVLIIVYVAASNLEAITGGLGGIYIPTTVDTPAALGWTSLAMIAAFCFQKSVHGLLLRCTREEGVAARSIGINVHWERGVAFVLSGSIVGIGGGVFSQFVGEITPNAFYVSITFLTIAMLVVGGQRSLAGAVVGTVLISVVNEVLRNVESGLNLGAIHIPSRPGVAAIGLAVILLAVLILRPGGVTGGREIEWPPKLPRRRGVLPATGPADDAGVAKPTSPTVVANASVHRR